MATTATSRSWFYIMMGAVAVVAVSVGFFGTYIAPMARGTFEAPTIVHVHGLLAVSWVLLFATQPWLIRAGNVRTHMALGTVGVFLAFGVVVTLVLAQFYASSRDLAAGGGAMAKAMIIGVFSSGAIFLALVLAAVLYRRHPTNHKRLMLLATIVVLWPAWFRWRHLFPSVPNPELWFGVVLADSLIVVAWLRDRLVRGHIAPVLRNVGVLIILENLWEVSLIGSPRWMAVGTQTYDALAPWLTPFIR